MIITFKTSAHPGSTINFALSVSDVRVHETLGAGSGHLIHMVGSVDYDKIKFQHEEDDEYLWSYYITEGEYENAYTHYYWLVDLNNFHKRPSLHELTEYGHRTILKAEAIAKSDIRNKKLDKILK